MRLPCLFFLISISFLVNGLVFGNNLINNKFDRVDRTFKNFITDSNFEDEMQLALKLHEEAIDFEGELKAAQSFVKISEEYPSEWLPAYWASYLYTQLTNILVADNNATQKGITIDSLISKSQNYLDLAKERNVGMSMNEEADFHNLQGLIYFFKARTAQSEELKNEYLSKRTKSISLAINLAPANPNAQVMAATELIRYGFNEKDLQKVLGGQILLEKAKSIYNNANPKGGMTTYWAKDFVEFWLDFANKTIRDFK